MVSRGITDPLADPDGDGINHLLLYALGGDLVANPRTVMPVASVTTVGAQSRLTITYRIRSGTTGMVVTPELSTTLGTWQSGAGVFEEGAPPVVNGDGTTTITVRTVAPVAASPSAFVRLFVQETP